MKKWIKWLIGISLILIVALLGYFSYEGYLMIEQNKQLAKENKGEKLISQSWKKSFETSQDSLKNLKIKFQSLKAEVKEAKEVKCPPVQVTFKIDDIDNYFKNREKTSKKEKIDEEVKEIVNENANLAGEKYIGNYSGSHGVTINEESKLVYYISDDELTSGESAPTISAPILNGKTTNQEFYWDPSKNFWVYESKTIITIKDLQKSRKISWCIYIGDHSQWNYDMYLPHEIIKTGSSSVSDAIAKGEIAQHKNDDGYEYSSIIQYQSK